MTEPQHMQALARANRVRLARAELRRSIRRGDVDVAGLLAPDSAIPWEARSMTFGALLASQYRWGTARARKLATRLGIPERRALESLTKRERRKLVGALHGHQALGESTLPHRQEVVQGFGPGMLG
jgi:hypothetical protein